MTKRNHSAAARKTRRTMKKMKEARAEYGPEYLDLIEAIGKKEPPNRRLAYTRVLPCPDFSGK